MAKLVKHKLELTLAQRSPVKEQTQAPLPWLQRMMSGSLVSQPSKASEDAQNREDASRRLVMYMELGTIATKLQFMRISSELVRALLIQFASTHKIKDDMLNRLLVDYTAAQPLLRKTSFTKLEREQRASERRQKLVTRCKTPAALLIFSAIDYVDSKSGLRNLLLVSKELNNLLRKPVLKRVLEHSPAQIGPVVWGDLLHDPRLCELYHALNGEKRLLFIGRNEEIRNLIQLDVLRSFHNYEKSEQEASEVN